MSVLALMYFVLRPSPIAVEAEHLNANSTPLGSPPIMKWVESAARGISTSSTCRSDCIA